MATPACLRPPPPPQRKSRVLFPSLIKTRWSENSEGKLIRRYSLRRKNNIDRCSSTYQSFSKDFYDGSVVFRNPEKYAESNQDHSTISKKYLSLSRTTSLNSVLSRSHSDSNLSSISENGVLYNSTIPINDYGISRYFRVFNGSWKNLLNLGMNKGQKAPPQMKKVPPPAIPDNCNTYRHSGSSFGSVGYSSCGEDSCFVEPIKENYDGNECYGMPMPQAGRSPNSHISYPTFTFPTNGQYAQIQTVGGKSSVYYHHQNSLQEDQGIDMTQSPGRDSPGSSGSGSGSRHSTVSVDSGRASGCHLTTVHSRSSSSSASSTDIPAKVEQLLMQGVADQDVLHSWLLDLHYEEYYPLFVSSGYDMHTIVRMTPEDLTAIGIKKPNHRKRLKAEIAQLNISDGLPDYIPGSLSEWLRLLRLEEYKGVLTSQGYETIDDVLQLTWEDLEDTGIVKLGHQKRLLLAIKRITDLKAGKVFPQNNINHNANILQTQVSIECCTPCNAISCYTSAPSTDFDCPRVHTTYRSFHQPWEIETTQQLYYTNDIVPIKINTGRGKSLENLKEKSNNCIVGGTSSFIGNSVNQTSTQIPYGWRPRSYDDGDITPTNETVTMHEGGGTLPRPRGLVKPRPVAKIPAIFCPAYRNEESDRMDMKDSKRIPPSPPKRHSETITVVAELHCSQIPPEPAPSTPPWTTEERQLIASLKVQSADCSFKSSTSSNESDCLPFANENAGTIKQRNVRTTTDYVPTRPTEGTENLQVSSASKNTLKKEPVDVLDDIGNMLANLTDELDAMLEEERRQGLNND